MPLREQSRIKGSYEPSAPPAGVPVCPYRFEWCNATPCDNRRCAELHDHRCSGCQAGRPLNPPPSDPVTVATGGVVCTSFMATQVGPMAPFSPCDTCGKMQASHDIDTARSVPPGPEVEELRGRADDRVRSMREAAAKETERLYGVDNVAAKRIRSLPLDTGTATDASGEAQADAIKAAVAAANNRAADAFRDWLCGTRPLSLLTSNQFEAWLRSGEDAPVAVGK